MNLLNYAQRPAFDAISPRYEMGAYEALWLQKGATFKTIAQKFGDTHDKRPSDFVSAPDAEAAYQEAMRLLQISNVKRFGVRIHGAGDYPRRLRDAKEPVELLYYQGSWDLVETPSIAIVGTRQPTNDGVSRARKLAKLLVQNNFTVVSGLAAGIDTAAHTAALEVEGRTIAVIGTPIGKFYPKENLALQKRLADDHLVISQVPIVRYERQAVPQNRLFFPERNKTMSALTLATVIVEAGETSGTLTQARAALHQGRKLFLLDSLFHRSDLSWPKKFLDQGAIRVKEFEEILEHASPKQVSEG